MNTIVAIALSCLLLLVPGGKDKKDYFAKQISASRYVAVVPLQGKDITRQSQEDLQAQSDIETALRKWKRFVVVNNPAAADLIIAFRRGNVASVKVGPVYRGGKVGMAETGSAGSANDLFEVYLSRNNPTPLDAPALWRYSSRDCLDSPNVPAVVLFRKVVEEAEKP